MTNVVQFGLLGIGLGAIYALMGQGIVLIYRGSGVLNIAQGGFAMFGAYLYLQLHVPGNLGSLTATKGWPVLPSFVVAVAATALIGLATDQLLLRRMRKASPLARLIATVGVLLVLQAGAAKIWGATPPFVPSILPTQIWHVSSSITLPSSYVWLLGIAVAITVLLTVMWRFTRIGWVTAAVSQNERGAAALGISPGFVSSATWMAGAALAAVAGILFSPITQVSIGGMSLLVIPVLAAVLLGGFDSFPATLASGMLVGIAQTIALNYNDFFERHLHITRGVGCPSAADRGGGDADPRIVAAAAGPHVGASAGDRHRPHPLGGGPSGCRDHLGSHLRGAWGTPSSSRSR